MKLQEVKTDGRIETPLQKTRLEIIRLKIKWFLSKAGLGMVEYVKYSSCKSWSYPRLYQ